MNNEPLCACGQLWITPVDNLPPRGRDSTVSSLKDKSFKEGQLVDALVDAVDLLAARIDGLEHQLLKLIGILDQPLSPAESLEALRRLREGMG